MGLGRGCVGRFWTLSGKGFGLTRGGFGEMVLGFGLGLGCPRMVRVSAVGQFGVVRHAKKA